MQYGPQKTLDVLFVITVIGMIGIAFSLVMSYDISNDTNNDTEEIIYLGYDLYLKDQSVRQNDVECFTGWYIEKIVLDEDELTKSILEQIKKYGPYVDVTDREVHISPFDHDEMSIRIEGVWTTNATQFEELDIIIKKYIDEKLIIDSGIISCY